MYRASGYKISPKPAAISSCCICASASPPTSALLR